jgi:hypothetical protein
MNKKCDNVLRGQGYRASQATVIDGYGARVEWWLAVEIGRNSETYLLPVEYGPIYGGSHMMSPGIHIPVIRIALYGRVPRNVVDLLNSLESCIN